MAGKNIGENYQCAICGNEVEVTKVGGGSLYCCGQEMKRIEIKEKTPPPVNLPDSDG